MRIPLAALLLCAAAPVCDAYGLFAHRLIAKLSWMLLEGGTRTWIAELLPPGVSFQSLAVWPDTIKRKRGYEWTRRLHYADLHDDPPHFCQDRHDFERVAEDAVNASINYTIRSSHAATAADLAFLVHFLADMHMPLHRTRRPPPRHPLTKVCGKARGGNDIRLHDRRRRRNIQLHYLLDSLIFHVRRGSVHA